MASKSCNNKGDVSGVDGFWEKEVDSAVEVKIESWIEEENEMMRFVVAVISVENIEPKHRMLEANQKKKKIHYVLEVLKSSLYDDVSKVTREVAEEEVPSASMFVVKVVNEDSFEIGDEAVE